MNEELDLKKDQPTLITKKGVKEVYSLWIKNKGSDSK